MDSVAAPQRKSPADRQTFRASTCGGTCKGGGAASGGARRGGTCGGAGAAKEMAIDGRGRGRRAWGEK